MAAPFLRRVLREPSYGWTRDGVTAYKPTTQEILAEWLRRMDVFHDRKAWLAFTGWFWTMLLLPFLLVFLVRYFSWPLMLVGFLYAMVWIGTHGTVWLHRYSTHRAFHIRNRAWRTVLRNLSVKIVAEETYAVSHQAHHAYSDGIGNPYNAGCGLLYCFLAGELHQPIRRDLDERDYEHVCSLLRHTGLRLNTYAQYQYWGTATNPWTTQLHYALNWAFWYATFYALGGHALACAIFGWSFVWGVGIRTHNWDLHAGGRDARRDGIDFDRNSLAVNALWPGIVAGEWHNNHHLFPQGVRAGFLWWQVDSAFATIWLLRAVGAVTDWRDFKDRFFERHYNPWLAARRAALAGAAAESSASTVAAPNTASRA